MTDNGCETSTYRVFDEVLLVLSESHEMREHIDCFLRCLRLPGEECTTPTVRLAVFRAPSDRLILCSPELGIAHNLAIGRPSWVGFRGFFLRLAMNGLPAHFTLHASSFAGEDHSVGIVAGSSNSGKTSTLSMLLRRGFRVACDDYAVLDLETAQLRALPLGVTATQGTFDRLPELERLKNDACKFHCEGQWQWTINLGDVYPTAAAFASYEPTHFFFVTPDFGNTSSIQKLSREEALWWFQSARFESPICMGPFGYDPSEYQRRCYAMTQRLADRAHFFRVVNGDVQTTADLIAEEFSKGPK